MKTDYAREKSSKQCKNAVISRKHSACRITVSRCNLRTDVTFTHYCVYKQKTNLKFLFPHPNALVKILLSKMITRTLSIPALQALKKLDSNYTEDHDSFQDSKFSSVHEFMPSVGAI